MAVRVVSLPAVSSRMKNEASSPEVRASPSMLVVISAVVRSSVGSSVRRALNSFISWVSSSPAPMRASTGSVPSGMNSGSPLLRMMFEQRSTVAYSEAGTPIMSQMISRGSGAAKCGDEITLAQARRPDR